MRTHVVFLDAFGTLLCMDPPAPLLTALLADTGYSLPESVVAHALAVEIGHYRSRMQMGCDAAGLASLRTECASVLVKALGPGAPPVPLATDLLVQSLRFRLYDDALPAMDALDDLGLRLGVVSNWDCALSAHLAHLGVADRFVVIAASASVGARKPDAAIFNHALAAARVAPQQALHVGDRRVEDLEGARAAGLRALLIDRGPDARADHDRITSLHEVAQHVATPAGG